MILDEKVEIIINNNNLEHYKSLGYNALYRESLIIDVMDLTIGSHYRVNVECDVCSVNNRIEFRQLGGSKYYTCRKCAAQNRKPVRKRTDDENKKIIDKTRRTKLERYGDENYQNSEKTKQTKLERYGDENYQNSEKTKQTKLERYGDENYNNMEKRRKTLSVLYNNPSFNNQCKKEKTCLERYGVRHTNQLPHIMDKINKSGNFLNTHKTNIRYRGSYECHFLDYCLLNNIKIESYIGNIKYFLNGKEHRYYPDFYHKESNTIIEIKSEYTYNKNKEINELKREYSLKLGYNFLFLINKNYKDFNKIVGL